mgnify:CR=1 FL=1
MNVQDAFFYQTLYHLIHLPGTGRTLTLSIGGSDKALRFTYDAHAHLILTIPLDPLTDTEQQRIVQTLRDYALQTEGLIEFPLSGASPLQLEVRLVNNNEFVAETLARLVLVQGMELPEDVELEVHKDYRDHDSLSRIVAAFARLRGRPQGNVAVFHAHSRRSLQFMYEAEYRAFLMELEVASLDTAERDRARAWFVTRGFQLWDHDRGICLQMMEPESASLPVLQLRFEANPDEAARYVLDVFMTVFELPLDVVLTVQET